MTSAEEIREVMKKHDEEVIKKFIEKLKSKTVTISGCDYIKISDIER